MPQAGLEPARHRCRGILSPLRLPIPSLGLKRDFNFTVRPLRLQYSPRHIFLIKEMNQ